MLSQSEILGASILIVDDQAADVRLLEHTLGDAGYHQLATTTDPREVCALHQSRRFDLILLDLQMPGMDGFEVMEGLKAIPVEHSLPVIALTSHPEHKQRALQAGATDFINKPFDLVEVKTRIHNMLQLRLLTRSLERHNEMLERIVRERTAELRSSEMRFRRFTELASDWYWEQNASGDVTTAHGPVEEMLGLGFSAYLGGHSDDETMGWDPAERRALLAKIAARQPFLDFAFSRTDKDGSRRQFRVSGEPIFDSACRFTGYRGIGVEVNLGHQAMNRGH